MVYPLPWPSPINMERELTPADSPLSTRGRELERGEKCDKFPFTSVPQPPYNILNVLSVYGNNAPSLFWPLGPCWAFWKCPCSTALGSWRGSPERLSKCLGAFHLSNCTTKAVTQTAEQGNLHLDSQPSLGMRRTKRLGSSEPPPKASSRRP